MLLREVVHVSLLATLSCSPVSAQNLDRRLENALNHFLCDYGTFKNFSDVQPSAVEKKLTPDRQAVFHAVIRALIHTPVISKGKPVRPLIDYVGGVTGIWGVRPGDTEGRRQFRLSVVWKKELSLELNQATNFSKELWPWAGHVLLPGPDDNPRAPARDLTLIRRNAVRSFRQVRRRSPKLQVAFLHEDPSVGEVDLDFDDINDPCHQKPSNSDPGSEADPHSHLMLFNDAFTFQGGELRMAYVDSKNHCRDSYQ